MIKIRGYFNKYGFEDGDNEELLNHAYEARPRVTKMVTDVLKKMNFGNVQNPEMVEYEVGTAHNPCRAIIVWSSGKAMFEWDEDHGVQVDCGNAGRESIHGRMQPVRGGEDRRTPCWIEEALEEAQKNLQKINKKGGKDAKNRKSCSRIIRRRQIMVCGCA